MKHPEFLCIVGRDVKWFKHLGKLFGGFLKSYTYIFLSDSLKTIMLRVSNPDLLHDTDVPTCRYLARSKKQTKTKKHMLTKMSCTRTFISGLFIIGPNWK